MLMRTISVALMALAATQAEARPSTFLEDVRKRYGAGVQLVWPPHPLQLGASDQLMPGAQIPFITPGLTKEPVLSLLNTRVCGEANFDFGRGTKTAPFPIQSFSALAPSVGQDAGQLLGLDDSARGVVDHFQIALSGARFFTLPYDIRRTLEARALKKPDCASSPRATLRSISMSFVADLLFILHATEPLSESALQRVANSVSPSSQPVMRTQKTSAGYSYSFSMPNRVFALVLSEDRQ